MFWDAYGGRGLRSQLPCTGPVVLNGAVFVQDVAENVVLLVAPGPTSWNSITWATEQWATKFVFQDVVLAKKLSRGPWLDCFRRVGFQNRHFSLWPCPCHDLEGLFKTDVLVDTGLGMGENVSRWDVLAQVPLKVV